MTQEVKGLKGIGEKVEGEIFIFQGTSFLEINSQVARKIIVSESFDRIALLKALALGAVGAVSSQIPEEFLRERIKDQGGFFLPSLSVLQVERESLLTLKENQGKKAILDPQNKKIILCP